MSSMPRRSKQINLSSIWGAGSRRCKEECTDRCCGDVQTDFPKRMSNVQGKGKGDRSKGKGKGRLSSQVQRREIFVLPEGSELSVSSSLRGAILGQGGENFKAITDETGVSVRLSGHGSSRQEQASNQDGPLRIVLTSSQPENLASAVELAKDLVDFVREKLSRHGRKHQHGPRESTGKGRMSDNKGKGKGEMVARYLQEQRQHMKKELAETNRQIEETKEKAMEKKDVAREKCRILAQLMDQADPVLTEEVQQARSDFNQTGSSDALYAFWAALEKSRESSQSNEKIEARKAVVAARADAAAAASSIIELKKNAKDLKNASTMLTVGNLNKCAGRCCALYANGSCPFEAGKCPRGSHAKPDAPSENNVFGKITKAKLRLLQQKWTNAGGHGHLLNAWQVRNPQLEFLFRGAEANFSELYGELSDIIDAWHGSSEQNIVSIAINGFDPKRRSGQVYGAGEYFAKNPNVSMGYAGGGSFMFLCKILLGKQDVDHTWASGPQFYVIKQRESRVQVMPIFLVQFKASSSSFSRMLVNELALSQDVEEAGALAAQQRGGLYACEARRDAGMTATCTRHLWLGWLAPSLRFKNDDGIAEDVCEFLRGISVEQVVPERNGARIGAFVLLDHPIDQSTFLELGERKYHGEWTISVDDSQPGNPKCAGKPCPRLCGPSKYCRGWNIRGHTSWNWGCPFAHPEDLRPTFAVEVGLETVPPNSAKFDEIQTEMRRSMPYARIVKVQRSQNMALEKMYDERRKFLHDKHGFTVEKELWHGTSVDAIPTLLQHGLQPPADSVPSDACPFSGKKGLCTTLCGTECGHCTSAHRWGKCHMYGLGVYLADIAQKSHQYVRKSGRSTYSMLLCRVCLGNPYLIEGNLLSGPAMHDVCWCQDPCEFLESLAEDWSIAKGHDSYYVKGQGGCQKHGLGVHNNEYIVFQPYQILPLYRVDYTL